MFLTSCLNYCGQRYNLKMGQVNNPAIQLLAKFYICNESKHTYSTIQIDVLSIYK